MAGATAARATARTAVVGGPGSVQLAQAELPEPGPTEVRIRVEGCGVCGSDLAVYAGRPWFDYPREPGAPGHETWGVVEAVGAHVRDARAGDRVAALSYHGYATHDLAEAETLVALPPELEGEPFPGEALGCAINVFARSAIHEGQTVAVVGVGFLGALLVQLAARAGAHVIAISRRRSARDTAGAMGATDVLALDEATVDRIDELTGGALCDRVVEAAGRQESLDVAAQLTRVRGRLVIAGFHQDAERRVDMQLWNWRGLDVINAHERDRLVYLEGMRAAAAAVAEGRLDPSPLYTHRFDLHELDDALRTALERPEGFMKALVAP